MLAAEAGGGSIGDLLPTFVTPGSVRAQKDQLNPSFLSTDAAVKACVGLPPEERASWGLFFDSWVRYRDSEETFWGVNAEWKAGKVFEESLSRWQSLLASSCAMPAPHVVTSGDVAPDLSAVKWAAAAVICVAVVWGVRSVVK